LYEQLASQGLAQDKESAEIYYNLGNAYFRNNQTGKAILNYERALLLDPGDRDIRHNLRFARTRTEDRIIPAGSFFLSNWIAGIQNLFSSNTWAVIGIVCFLVFLVCLGAFLFFRVMWVKKVAFYAAIPVFIFVVAANIFSFGQKNKLIHRETGIVMTGSASVMASPDADSNELFLLHEGAKVRITNTDVNWFEVEIENGSVGWTPKENVEII